MKDIIFYVLVLFGSLQTVQCDAQEGRLDLLKGKKGESACELKESIYKGCKVLPPSTYNATYETPESCTCNIVFFNIWSACSYSIGENLFPRLEDWHTICRSSGINLPQSQLLADQNSWGVDAPVWARIGVPGNDTMDLQEAVFVVASSWNLIQILLPIITAVAAVILTVIVMQLYQKRLRQTQWRGKMLRFVRPVQRVKTVDKEDSWAIESPIDDARRYELVTPSPDMNASMYPFGPTVHRQRQAQSEPLVRNMHGKGESFDAFDSRTSLAGSWRMPPSLKNLRAPWKKGPTRVQDVVATTEFDIDNYQLTPASTSSFGFPSAPDGESNFPRRSGFEVGEEINLMTTNERQSMAATGQVAPATIPSSGHAVSLNEQDNSHGYSDPFGEPPGLRR